MSERLSLTLFAHVASRPDADLDLVQAALLVGEIEGPGLDLAPSTRAIEDLGRRARVAAAGASSDESRMDRILRFLYEDAGFHGNDEDYYDPRNSFLHEVIERRTGIPITLAVMLGEVCRKAGVEVRGVSFPGHFLVRADTARGILVVDPFAGRLLTRDDLRALFARATGEGGDPPGRMLEPATKAQILARILNNLRGIYESRRDDERLRRVLARLQVVTPSEDLRQRVAELGGSEPFRRGGSGLN
jgi:regulator of sirC expression with transglutaminase-like and TPR domain